MHAPAILVALLGQHLLPAIFASVVMLAALALLFRVGRLRRPAFRVWFLYVAFLKVLVAVWTGEGISCLEVRSERLGYGVVRLPTILAPDRLHILAPNGLEIHAKQLIAVVATSKQSEGVFIAVVVLLLALFCYRWFRLAPLFRGLREVSILGPDQFPEVHRTFRDLVGRAWGRSTWPPRPRLLIVRGGSFFAFTMGIRPPVIVLTAELVEQLGDVELRGILAHELAHVRRLDYLGRWAAAILRDLMAWNPVVLLWFEQLVIDQEKASDEQAAELLDDPGAVASGLVELAASAGRVPLASVGPLSAWRKGMRQRVLEARLAHLKHVSDHGAPPASWRLLVLPLLIAFAMVQPHVVIALNQLSDPIHHLLGRPGPSPS